MPKPAITSLERIIRELARTESLRVLEPYRVVLEKLDAVLGSAAPRELQPRLRRAKSGTGPKRRRGSRRARTFGHGDKVFYEEAGKRFEAMVIRFDSGGSVLLERDLDLARVLVPAEDVELHG